jgi:flagellum-specific ATP synthase
MDAAIATVASLDPRAVEGTVVAVRGLTLSVSRLRLPVGSLVAIDAVAGGTPLRGEIIGFDGDRSLVMLLGNAAGVAPGAIVRGERIGATVAIGDSWLGRVVDALGRPIDGGPPLEGLEPRPLEPPLLNPLGRDLIRVPLATGVRALDGLLTVGRGQRMGIVAGPGVGKSTLLGSIARGTSAPVSVLGLVGERGREVREFLDATLGPDGLARATVIVATGDESPLMRVKAALAAVAAAEAFRAKGLDVLLMIDSITRYAQALRQVALAAGEQPATRGYPPSVFAALPRLLERAGPISGGGSITGFYTVLVDGDDLSEPVTDAARSILDGQVTLSRKLAARGHHPAIDPLESVSRVADAVVPPELAARRREILRLAAIHREQEELLSIGAYVRGANPELDLAIAMQSRIEAFLRQERDDTSGWEATVAAVTTLSDEIAEARAILASHPAGAAA